MNNEDTITIPLKEYKALTKQSIFLNCLEGAGVDKWDGYSYAQECYEDQENNDNPN